MATMTHTATDVELQKPQQEQQQQQQQSSSFSASSVAARRLAAGLLAHDHTPYAFAFTPFLQATYHHGLAADRSICKAYSAGHCPLGPRCPDRHVSASSGHAGGGGGRDREGGFNSLVCKHWLRGLCKKGEGCEFLHEYNLRKMPECNFFLRNGFCSNGDECLYLHIDPRSKLPPCPDYDNRGFCALGPRCPKKHVRRLLCPCYLAGFCPSGRACKDGAHPHWAAVAVVAPAVAAAEAEAAEAAEAAGQNQNQDGEYNPFGHSGAGGDDDTAMAGTPDDDSHHHNNFHHYQQQQQQHGDGDDDRADRFGQNFRGGFKDKFGSGGGRGTGGGSGSGGGRWRGRGGGGGRGFRGRGH